LIRKSIVIGLKPEDVRGMIARDLWLCFEGWNEAHERPKPGSDAPTRDEYRELVGRVDGN
jgi:hypothetical protein